MSPEISINDETMGKVVAFVEKQPSHWGPSMLSDGARNSTMYMVGDEPLVIEQSFSEESHDISLSCSRAQANLLEKAGIVKFPKSTKKE